MRISKFNHNFGQWVAEVSDNSFNGSNGVFYTKRNYYLKTKNNTVHYQTMNCDNASYDNLYDIYYDFGTGVHVYYGIASDDSLEGKIAKCRSNINKATAKDIEIFKSYLITI